MPFYGFSFWLITITLLYVWKIQILAVTPATPVFFLQVAFFLFLSLSVYTVLPLRLSWALSFGIGASVCHIVVISAYVSVTSPETHDLAVQVTVTHLCTLTWTLHGWSEEMLYAKPVQLRPPADFPVTTRIQNLLCVSVGGERSAVHVHQLCGRVSPVAHWACSQKVQQETRRFQQKPLHAGQTETRSGIDSHMCDLKRSTLLNTQVHREHVAITLNNCFYYFQIYIFLFWFY